MTIKPKSHRTLYIHEAGPLISYLGGTLVIKNLNPEVFTKWRMSRVELMRFGWRCIVAAVRAPSDAQKLRNLKKALAEDDQ